MLGSACLDFVNTLDDRFSEQPKELLKQYVDVARFAEDAGVLSAGQVDSLIEWSGQAPGEAKRALTSAIELREAISAIFYAVARRKAVPSASLVMLNARVQDAAQHLNLAPGKGRFEWRFDVPKYELFAPLWPIARDAAELMASDRLAFVRTCASRTCEWLFLDESKNHGRRWCDMTKCGNRAKARQYYARRKTAQ